MFCKKCGSFILVPEKTIEPELICCPNGHPVYEPTVEFVPPLLPSDLENNWLLLIKGQSMNFSQLKVLKNFFSEYSGKVANETFCTMNVLQLHHFFSDKKEIVIFERLGLSQVKQVQHALEEVGIQVVLKEI